MSPSYALDEPADIINDEVAWLQGAFVSSLLCGVQITLSIMSFFAVLRQRLHHRLRIALLVYIFLLCAIMTAGQQSNLFFVQMGFIERRNYPGGPNGFLSSRFLMPADLASTCLFVFANWMMETLLVSVGVWVFDDAINFKCSRYGDVKLFVARETGPSGAGSSLRPRCWFLNMVCPSRHPDHG